jgi:eukaryotic-like serine/threonine-protein kinase
MATPLERLTRALADRYRVERELGAGGMATVYLAHDLRHDRDVAIKVLHPDLGAALGGERFLSEIRTTAKLQHPHILPLLDSGEADGLLFYAMPYVRGETLRERLTRETQLPVADALRMAGEIADALMEAHNSGIVHRDIKPENILLSGAHALVADFGIALAVQHAGGARMTQTGLSLGTPQYMAPEQAMGDKQVDHRADQYALAAVTYEMLTGEPPHSGSNAQAIVAKLLTEQVRPATVLRPTVPMHVDVALRTALEKLPADRFTDIAAFHAALRDGRGTGAARAIATATPAARAPTRTMRLATFGVIGLLLGAAIGWGGATMLRPATTARVSFAFRLPGDHVGFDIAISRDGSQVLRVVRDSLGVQRVALRTLGDTAVSLITGTAGVAAAGFSPDGASIAFVTQPGELRRVSVAGGPSTRLADLAMSVTPSWSDDGFIYFARVGEGIFRVPADGGTEARVSRLDSTRKEFGHWFPQALAGGTHVLFHSYTAPLDSSRIEVVEIATGTRTPIITYGFNPRVTASGHLLFMREGTLLAAPFDARNTRITREPVAVLEDVAWNISDGTAAYDVSRTGTLVFVRASESRQRNDIRWVSRAGIPSAPLIPAGPWVEPRVSPNEAWIALTRSEERASVWLFDVARGVLTPLSRSAGSAFAPTWLPDSRGVVHVVETPAYDIALTRLDASPTDTLIVSGVDKVPSDVSPDGQLIAFTRVERGDNINLAPITGGTGTPLGTRERSQQNAVFSPDGRWIAWSELDPNEVPQIFVRRLDGTVLRVQVSAAGGTQPRWTKGGAELIYRRGTGVFAAPFDAAAGRAGTPTLLFSIAEDESSNRRTRGFDVSADGQRFLMTIPADRSRSLPNVVVTEWLGELRAKVPR